MALAVKSSLSFDPPCLDYEQPSLHSPPFPSGRKCVILGLRNSGSQRSGGAAMTFDDMLAQIIALLQREKRVSYRALKRRFALDDEYLEDLKDELIKAKRLAMDEEGSVLVWTGDPQTVAAQSDQRLHQPAAQQQPSPEVTPLSAVPPDAE